MAEERRCYQVGYEREKARAQTALDDLCAEATAVAVERSEVKRLRVALGQIADVSDADDGTDVMARLERCVEMAGRALYPNAPLAAPSAPISDDLKENPGAAAPQALEYCDRCDGCGWYEGGKTIKTTCEKCGGTGVVASGNPPVAAAAARVPRAYAVNVYDSAGQFSETACQDFPAALAECRASRAKYPGKVVAVFNYERCDERCDGLTDQEREAIDE